MKKYKVTYFSGGCLMRKVFSMNCWNDFVFIIQNEAINEWEIISVELVPVEAK